jgi:hypothetical protein
MDLTLGTKNPRGVLGLGSVVKISTLADQREGIIQIYSFVLHCD